MPARALVIFSTGAEGSSVSNEDLAGQAVAADVPIYPVALPGFPWVLPYEGYTYRSPVKNGFYYFYASKDDGEDGAGLSMLGAGGASVANGSTRCCGPPYAGSYYNYPFELLADLTGGLRFHAINRLVSADAGAPGRVLLLRPDGYSMTGSETRDILERVKKHALARFRSDYTVGFVPPPSATPREHKLEVKLAAKSSGKLTEGKRNAAY